MSIKMLKTGVISTNLEGTDYLIKLSSEEEHEKQKKKYNKYKVEMKETNKSVMIEKVVVGENAPEYKVNGEGMEKEEMVTFAQNWFAKFFGSLESFGSVVDNLDHPEPSSIWEPFFHRFNHFFGERLFEMMD
jgi:hypothetical protein